LSCWSTDYAVVVKSGNLLMLTDVSRTSTFPSIHSSCYKPCFTFYHKEIPLEPTFQPNIRGNVFTSVFWWLYEDFARQCIGKLLDQHLTFNPFDMSWKYLLCVYTDEFVSSNVVISLR